MPFVKPVQYGQYKNGQCRPGYKVDFNCWNDHIKVSFYFCSSRSPRAWQQNENETDKVSSYFVSYEGKRKSKRGRIPCGRISFQTGIIFFWKRKSWLGRKQSSLTLVFFRENSIDSLFIHSSLYWECFWNTYQVFVNYL